MFTVHMSHLSEGGQWMSGCMDLELGRMWQGHKSGSYQYKENN